MDTTLHRSGEASGISSQLRNRLCRRLQLGIMRGFESTKAGASDLLYSMHKIPPRPPRYLAAEGNWECWVERWRILVPSECAWFWQVKSIERISTAF